ncbi:uncharacterized protein LOC142884778 [Nelusetta ayraudi]|uniref:uncharacterized protein LOC142884778 n=1 Tax=Nelusetta ayraudi TaxID=303726 RepID=UPI003F72DF20
MAAPCFSAVRSAFKGVNHVVPRWVLLTQTPAVGQCFRLHAPSAAVLCRSSTVKPPQVGPHSTDGKRAEEPEEPEGPEYIPKKKAKNPMMNIGYAWMIGLPTGVIGFLLAKRQVDKNRLKQLKIRQRMKRSNEGEYERSRYRHSAEDVKLDT